MIRHLKLRLLAAIATPLLVLHPQAAQCAPATAPATGTRLDHISIIVTGTGSPVILIPGLASPRAVWDGVVPDLAKTHRVYLVQVNGFGGDAPGGNLTPGLLDGIVSDLDAYIVAHRLTGVQLVGHSMGGLAAMLFAKAHPDHVARIMVVDALPYFAVLMAPPGIDPTPAMVAPQAAMMRDRIAASYGKPLDPAAAEAQTRGLALKPDSIAKMKRWAAAADPRVTAEALYEDLTTDLRPALAAIATPITLVYPWNAGGPTRPMVDAFYRKQYAPGPHITYVDIGDAAHFVMLDQPAAFQAALSRFVEGG